MLALEEAGELSKVLAKMESNSPLFNLFRLIWFSLFSSSPEVLEEETVDIMDSSSKWDPEDEELVSSSLRSLRSMSSSLALRLCRLTALTLTLRGSAHTTSTQIFLTPDPVVMACIRTLLLSSRSSSSSLTISCLRLSIEAVVTGTDATGGRCNGDVGGLVACNPMVSHCK